MHRPTPNTYRPRRHPSPFMQVHGIHQPYHRGTQVKRCSALAVRGKVTGTHSPSTRCFRLLLTRLHRHRHIPIFTGHLLSPRAPAQTKVQNVSSREHSRFMVANGFGIHDDHGTHHCGCALCGFALAVVWGTIKTRLAVAGGLCFAMLLEFGSVASPSPRNIPFPFRCTQSLSARPPRVKQNFGFGYPCPPREPVHSPVLNVLFFMRRGTNGVMFIRVAAF